MNQTSKVSFVSSNTQENTKKRGYSAGNLPESAVIEFQTHYQKRFGVLLTLIEARKLAVYLLDLYRFTAEETYD